MQQLIVEVILEKCVPLGDPKKRTFLTPFRWIPKDQVLKSRKARSRMFSQAFSNSRL